jgi:hypothetical protein
MAMFLHREWIAQESTPVAAVEDVLQRRANMDLAMKKHLEAVRHQMKQMADKHKSEREFSIGDLVFLKF